MKVERIVSSGQIARASRATPADLQWLLNDSPIPGKTGETLALENIGAAHAGRYAAVVTTFAEAEEVIRETIMEA